MPPFGRTDGAWGTPRARRVEPRGFLLLCLGAPSTFDLPVFGFGPVLAWGSGGGGQREGGGTRWCVVFLHVY